MDLNNSEELIDSDLLVFCTHGLRRTIQIRAKVRQTCIGRTPIELLSCPFGVGVMPDELVRATRRRPLRLFQFLLLVVFDRAIMPDFLVVVAPRQNAPARFLGLPRPVHPRHLLSS